jgi:hypothetical protein
VKFDHRRFASLVDDLRLHRGEHGIDDEADHTGFPCVSGERSKDGAIGALARQHDWVVADPALACDPAATNGNGAPLRMSSVELPPWDSS